jgi:tetratricopeptide (TPR) repeat protein
MAWLHYVGALCLILSAPMGWLNQPWGGWTRAIAWKPLSPPTEAKFALVSMGTLLVVVALASLIPSLRRCAVALSAVSAIILFLPVWQILFAHVNWCDALADEIKQRSAVLEFDASKLGGHVVSGLDIPRLDTANALERWGSLFSLLGWGWYVAAAGVTFLAVSGWHQTSRPQRRTIVLVLVVVLILGSVRGMVAELCQWRGDVALAKGDAARAIQHFRHAVRWNKSLDDTEHLRLSRGQIESVGNGTASIPVSADAHLFRAQALAERGDFVRAMEKFAQAHQRAPQSVVVQRLWARARVRWGLDLFHNRNIHLSIRQWEDALALDVHQQQAHFYLAKAFYDARDYEAAIRHNFAFLEQCRDRFLRSEIFSNLGDCRARQRNFVAARQMYQRSLRQYNDISYRITNFRARRGLMGM